MPVMSARFTLLFPRNVPPFSPCCARLFFLHSFALSVKRHSPRRTALRGFKSFKMFQSFKTFNKNLGVRHDMWFCWKTLWMLRRGSAWTENLQWFQTLLRSSWGSRRMNGGFSAESYVTFSPDQFRPTRLSGPAGRSCDRAPLDRKRKDRTNGVASWILTFPSIESSRYCVIALIRSRGVLSQFGSLSAHFFTEPQLSINACSGFPVKKHSPQRAQRAKR